MKSAVLAIVTATVVASAGAGNNCYWTGGGDGVNWSDDANWDVAPQDQHADVLWFTNSVSVYNDLLDITPSRLCFRGAGPVVVSGKQVLLQNGNVVFDSQCDVVMDAPIKVRNYNAQICIKTRTYFNGLITIDGAKQITMYAYSRDAPTSDPDSGIGTEPDVQINGGVSAPDGTLQFQLGKNSTTARPFFINSVLDVKNLYWYGGWRGQNGYVTVGGQKWKNAYVGYGRCCPAVENAYSPTAVLSWPTYRNANGDWDLNGYNQTIDRIWSETFPTNKTGVLQGDRVTSTAPATLTMNATGNGRCWAQVAGRVSLVWAPQTSDYAMDFFNRDYTTSGDLFVSNGTMSVSGTATFKNVGEIRVGNGATFDLKTTAANALQGAKNLLVEGTGVFRVAATAATPFSSVRVRLDAGAKLAVPSGVTLTIGALTVGGVAKANGTYTGETWIDGEGSVKVDSTTLAAASWKTSADGAWATASNWQGGAVPTATTAVTIDAAGADYTVTAADGTAHNAAIAVGSGAVNGTATLKVAGAFTQTKGTLTVNPGGRVEIGTGGSYGFVSDSSWRDPTKVVDVAGGEITINGGSFTADPFYGRMSISGAAQTPGRVTVKNGTFTVNPWQSGDGSATMQSLYVGWGGRIEIGNGGMFYPVSYGWGATPLLMEGGEIAVSGSGVWNACHASSKNEARTYYKGYGQVTFSDDAQLTAPSPKTLLIQSSNTWYPFDWSFSDRAKMDMTSGSLGVQGGAWDTPFASTVSLTLDSTATHNLGGTCWVGGCQGRGVLNIKRGVVQVGSYCLSVGGICGTASQTSFAPTGTVNMTGGTLSVNGLHNGTAIKFVTGIVVGSTLYEDGSKMPKTACGTFNLSGGVVTNELGHVVVGVGRGVGTFNQSGGEVVAKYNTRGGSSFEGSLFVLGCLNGKGTWKMTGGTTDSESSVYVGGCDTNRFHNPLNLGGHTEDSLAKGLLSVENATFSTARKMVLGERGTGTLEIGPAGLVSVGGDFAVSNVASTVSITLGTDGSGSLTIAGDLAVEAGAKLTIDASAVDPDALEHGINVMTWGAASRPYADADVTFVGDAKGVLRLKKTAHGYRIPGTRGMIIKVR